MVCLGKENFTSDDYETPDYIAQAISKLVLPSDQFILEPFAGTGQIVKFLPNDCFVDAVEVKTSRYLKLDRYSHYCYSYNRNFFGFEFNKNYSYPGYDLIVSNPPFSLIMEAIAYSLELLNQENPNARILFLVPVDTFSNVGRSQFLKNLNCHIHHTHLIPGRIDYLKNGIPMSKCQKVVNNEPQFKNGKPVMCSGRQVSDAVFDIRLNKDSTGTTFLF